MTTATSDPGEQARLARVAHDRAGLWIATGIEIAGLLVFAGVFNFLFPSFGDTLDGAPLIGLGLLFALIPAIIWLTFFYRMDRLDPEPKHMVINLFLLGALVTAGLRGPVLEGFFQTQNWLYSTWWAHLLGGVLVVAVIDQLIVFATVRYAIFNHPEFDERVDGIIYAVAVGLGLATILNFQYVWARGGVDLGIGSIRMIINALAYASFSGVLGYVIGQYRFEKVPPYYMPVGFSVAVLFNGLFFYLLDRTVASSISYNPWGDLIFAGIVAAITGAVLFWLIARANEETLRLANEQARHNPITPLPGLPPALVPAPAESRAPAAPPASTTSDDTSAGTSATTSSETSASQNPGEAA